MKIPIYGRDKLNGNMPDKILILAWNYAKEIKKNNKDLNTEFISIKDLEK